MEAETTPEFIISPMRILTMPATTFFHVTSSPTAFADLDNVLDPLLEALDKARRAAPITAGGPDIVRYYPAGASGLYLMEVGTSARPETPRAGDARLKTLSPYHCAAVLLWGSLAHVEQAYGALRQAIQGAGLKAIGEVREYTYFFESPASPRNLMGIYMEIG